MSHPCEKAVKYIAELEAEDAKLRRELYIAHEVNALLRKALADAPHTKTCDSWDDDMPCDCWKAALAVSTRKL